MPADMIQPSNNAAAGAQPGPLPVVHRVTPVNPVGGVKRYDEMRPGLPDRIIYHSTVSPNTTGSSAEWLSTNKYSGVSTHSLANRDGSLTEIVPPMWKAYHAGYCLPGWSNATALGIEIENASGNARGDKEPYTDVQINAAAYRVATWAYSFGIPMERIKAHKDVAVYGPADPRAGQLGRKLDPVGDFPDERFRALVQAWLTFFNALPAASVPHYVQGAPEPPATPTVPSTVFGFKGPHTITEDVARRVLTDLNSPILGEYSLDSYFAVCTEHGLNFAVALAFTVHENKAGTAGPTVPLKNWGAVRTPENPALTAQNSPVMTELGSFAAYNFWLDALRDWCLRITGAKYLLTHPDWSVRQALYKYCPKGDPFGKNDPDAYADEVQRLCSEWQAESATPPAS